MKIKIASLAFALLLALVAMPVLADGGSWNGWVTDSHCGAGGAKAGHKDCAVKCVKGGATYVFYNSADQKIYKLDNQELAAANLENEVTVQGTLEGDTIKVASIAKKAS
jgi:hypothetical protein